MLDVISVAAKFSQRPSEIIGDLDTYTAFCFDEACTYILTCLQAEDKKGKKKNKLYFDEDLEKVQQQSQNFIGSLYDALKQDEENEV